MKLNHLILVICTGILVGFSACKKDPFTEADAIAAQKELITMKYGYELQLKNIEAAIEKAKSDALIVMKNLEIKGASDLQKQIAADNLAYTLATLARQAADNIAWQKFYDSLTAARAAINAANSAAATAAANALALLNSVSTVYNGSIRIMDGTVAVVGATVSIMKHDGSGYYTGTSDANGFVFIKDQRFLPSSPVSIKGPESDTKIYPIAYSSVSGIFGSLTPANSNPTAANVSFTLNSYAKESLSSIKGTVYAALDLTNGKSEGVFGTLVTAYQTVGSNGSLPGDTTAVTLSFVSTTLSTGAYTISLPKTGGALGAWTVKIPSYISAYQKAYTIGSGNMYQALPTKSDSIPVILDASSASVLPTTWPDAPAYFFSLPKSRTGYSVTLTDPNKLFLEILSDLSYGGANTPSGSSAADSTLKAKYRILAEGLRINNGWLTLAANADTNATYALPSVINLDSNNYKKYIALPAQVGGGLDVITPGVNYSYTTSAGLTPANTTLYVSREQVRLKYFADLASQVSATITAAVWTPTIATTTTYKNDTLAVNLVDLTGKLVISQPTISAVVGGATNADKNGFIKFIEILDAKKGGLFDIASVWEKAASATSLSSYNGTATNSRPIAKSSAANGMSQANSAGIAYYLFGNWEKPILGPTNAYYTSTSSPATSVNFNYGTVYGESAIRSQPSTAPAVTANSTIWVKP